MKPAENKLWNTDARRQTLSQAARSTPYPLRGRVHKVIGPVVEATGLQQSIGNSCDIMCSAGHTLSAEIVGFRDDRTILMPVGAIRGVAPGDAIRPSAQPPGIHVSEHLLGRVLDACGEPLDSLPLTAAGEFRPLHWHAINPVKRHIIDTPMGVGVRAIDACTPLGWGQRIGLFAGAGVGKSMLLGMVARNSDADINVIALVGERSREVREFLELALGKEALARSVVVVATSNLPPVLRVRAALIATTIAESFRDKGKNVLLMMDSLTRFAQAQREIGLTLGEAPASKGFTPSCFTAMAELLERAGPGEEDKGGNISGIYTVLVEGDDLAGDPVADSAMAALDGHIILERSLAEQGHFPSISVLRSVSRLSTQIAMNNQMESVQVLRKELALFERMEDMINMGAYEKGSNPELDQVIGRIPAIRAFLQQKPEEKVTHAEACRGLASLMQR
ncbi:MAG: FliI/YscN family ATPase [Mariprofundaceae bacterium]